MYGVKKGTKKINQSIKLLGTHNSARICQSPTQQALMQKKIGKVAQSHQNSQILAQSPLRITPKALTSLKALGERYMETNPEKK